MSMLRSVIACLCGVLACSAQDRAPRADGVERALWITRWDWHGEPGLRETIARAGKLVGRALTSVAVLLDLRLATIAGSVALGFGAPFFAAAQQELDRSARIEYVRGVRVVPAALGRDGPLVGAAGVGLRAVTER